MLKVAFIGAGSIVFGKNVIADMLWHPALRDAHIALVDVDAERLDTARRLAESLAASFDAPITVTASTTWDDALDGADVVICAIGVGGFEATRIDHEIPARFGVRQIIGDTLGIGGVFRSIRSIPVMLQLCAAIEQRCPDAWLLNYVNPMATHCLAVARATRVKCVGLCHGVMNSARTVRMCIELARRPADEIWKHFELEYGSPERTAQWMDWWALGDDPAFTFTCAGINHMAVFTELRSGGRDLYPALWEAIDKPQIHRLDPVRFEMMKHFGYFMTETSGHMSEYLPYFMRDEKEMADNHLHAGHYLNICRNQDVGYQRMRRTLLAGEPVVTLPYEPSVEYAARIINALVTNEAYVFNGNVWNAGGRLISNVQPDSCVEVPCVVNAQGVQPTAVGSLPPQCAALITTNINVQDLIVRGILEGSRDHIRHAALVDPATAATLQPRVIRQMVDAMFDAYGKWLPPQLR